jgi:hypothetical protein
MSEIDKDTDNPTLWDHMEELCKLTVHYAEQLNTLDGGKRILFKHPSEWVARISELRAAGKDTTFADLPDDPNTITVDVGESVTLQHIQDNIDASKFGAAKFVGTPKSLDNNIKKLWDKTQRPQEERDVSPEHEQLEQVAGQRLPTGAEFAAAVIATSQEQEQADWKAATQETVDNLENADGAIELEGTKVWSDGYTDEENAKIIQQGEAYAGFMACSVHEWTWTDRQAALMAYTLFQHRYQIEQLENKIKELQEA